MGLNQIEANLKAEPGSYVLILRADKSRKIKIGKTGQLNLQPGYYIYVGSARGPGGVVSRVKHHYRTSSSPHWHMDYLSKEVELIAVWYIYSQASYEHKWADFFQSTAFEIPLKGFGASDCQCASHLFFSTQQPQWNKFQNESNTSLSAKQLKLSIK